MATYNNGDSSSSSGGENDSSVNDPRKISNTPVVGEYSDDAAAIESDGDFANKEKTF